MMANKNGFNPEDIGIVVEDSESNSLQVILSSMTLAISIFVLISNIKSAFYYNSDKKISVVEAPIRFDNDGVVLAKTRTAWSKSEKTRHIKAFVRSYMRSQFPQSEKDAKAASKTMQLLSVGSARKEANSRVSLSSDFASMIGKGEKITFYPDSMLEKVYITETSFGWKVIIDGSLIKVIDLKEVRSSPSLEYDIEEVDTTYENPWGLAVSSYEFVLPSSRK